jgi:hypothetical protein
MAGHVSKDMLKRYSHIRIQAKRQAVGDLVTKPKQAFPTEPKPTQSAQKSESVLQVSPQVATVN